MKKAGCQSVVLEATSHALSQGRLEGCNFRVAALTNVTQDHLDYHGTMDAYFAAKAMLFRQRVMNPGGVSVFLTDREDGCRMRQEASGAVLTVSTTEGASAADVVVGRRRLHEQGIDAELDTPIGRLSISSPLVGEFNLSNLALAAGMAVAHGRSADEIVRGVGSVEVPGRLQRVANDAGVLCVVDYAHTPDALERVMAVLRPLTTGRLIVVFGCGGDRDRGKRPIMGEAVARQADVAVVTSDNPRTEDPASIVDMVLEGVRRGADGRDGRSIAPEEMSTSRYGYHVEVDRRLAISRAVRAARAGDTLLIAGKGHEDYQIIGQTKIHFDDREEAATAFARARSGEAP
jgi:UDP-N-acetylmuramoyl-L-alanyl-D-glutamate--2,6-diaminopimelate ligase